MGYSYFIGIADTIEPTIIERVVPTAWVAFHQAVAQVAAAHDRDPDAVLADVGREDDRNDHEYDSDDEEYSKVVAEQVIPALDALRDAFTAATGGIGLHFGWISDDTLRGSDLYDEVFWWISGHEQPTPAYAALIDAYGSAVIKSWVTGG